MPTEISAKKPLLIPAALVAVGVALAGAYVLGSVRVAVRARTALDRGQYAAMAASVGLMSLALVV